MENQVTPTADTSIMAQKVIITRRKVYISPRTTKSQVYFYNIAKCTCILRLISNFNMLEIMLLLL